MLSTKRRLFLMHKKTISLIQKLKRFYTAHQTLPLMIPEVERCSTGYYAKTGVRSSFSQPSWN